MFCMLYVFSFPPGVCVVTLNLIASIPGPSIITFYTAPVVRHCSFLLILKSGHCKSVKVSGHLCFSVFHCKC